MKVKWLIAAAGIHIILAMFETAALYMTGQGTGEFGTPAAIAGLMDSLAEENLDFTLDIWSQESLRGTITNVFGATYRLITFGGYETFLGSGSGLPWLSVIPSAFGHLIIAVALWRLASVAISSFVGFLR